MMNADGTGEIRLTNTPEDEIEPDISPNGQTIVFTRGGSIYSINADGSSERRLTNSPNNSENASFNGSGDKLVFESDRGGTGFQIYVMNVDGSEQQTLTAGKSSNTDACFSPDGSQIVYVSIREEPDASLSGIYLMNAVGLNARRLVVPAPSVDIQPAFSPDGQQIIFSSNREGSYNLYTLRTDGTMLTRLTSIQGADVFPCWR